MCTSVCMYACMHACMYVCIIYTYLKKHISIYIYICVCVCVLQVYVGICLGRDRSRNRNGDTYMCMYTYTCQYLHIHRIQDKSGILAPALRANTPRYGLRSNHVQIFKVTALRHVPEGVFGIQLSAHFRKDVRTSD